MLLDFKQALIRHIFRRSLQCRCFVAVGYKVFRQESKKNKENCFFFLLLTFRKREKKTDRLREGSFLAAVTLRPCFVDMPQHMYTCNHEQIKCIKLLALPNCCRMNEIIHLGRCYYGEWSYIYYPEFIILQ